MWNSVIMEKQLPDSDFLDANIDATQFFLPFILQSVSLCPSAVIFLVEITQFHLWIWLFE